MASQTMNSSMQPTDVYGGDEVSAIVIDPGYSSIRAGFAGEDTPKSFINSHYGVRDGESFYGDNAIHNPSANLEIRNPMNKDGIVEDWDTAEQLWKYAITSRLTSFKQADPRTNGLNDRPEEMEADMDVDAHEKPLEEHPLLMTETAWNTAKSREKAIEVAMESWGSPAFWLARNSVLAAFGGGKATALVVDVGASNASVIAVHDGLVLKKSVQRSTLAGNWVSSQIRAMFNTVEPKVELTPHFMISSKTPVDAGAPAQATYRNFKIPPTPSFRALEEERVLTEFKESVVQVWSGPNRLNAPTGPGTLTTNVDYAKQQPGRVFEMPDGSNQMWGVERFNVTEGMWDEKAALPVDNESAPTKAQTLPEMIKASIAAVDMDLRSHLLQNIIVTGGSTLLNGFTDRLNNELSILYPGARIKLQAAGLTQERRFGSWIGGSILGSLGTFHQMWISRKEYEEFGASIVEKRCK
ncbi:uncharacterized protein EAF01_002531 [Botrytis porri]|uniref:Actin-related protein 4 n=1 Tax=Botrytis porri TaxID=87229 RepID=A0A4Z1L201_9HELO|nr:uncharacterized protein EAF01_002531 [Botrytis porri]KAF7911023.1 hypothetical protein EAF01_002531 [Botrytis porri]TGO90801.1 hypothetical protein BPOR_0050g00060 [Botrytis porri]